jgi:hypothetical protein
MVITTLKLVVSRKVRTYILVYLHFHTQAMWDITTTVLIPYIYLAQAMLERRLISPLCPLKINVAFKITVISKSNTRLSQIQY